MKVSAFALSVAALFGGLSASSVAHAAQTADEPGQEGKSDGESPNGEIIVTARLKAERLQDVPVAVTAISGHDLEKSAVTDIVSITQKVPSMVVGRAVSGSSASIYLRGVGSSAISSAFDQSVSLNLDGIPMSRGREILDAQYDIQQVEVLKGPQALFFGKNSTGGLITIASRDPTDHFEASLKAGYEFYGREAYGEGVISGPIAGDLLGRIAVRASRADGWFKNNAQAGVFGGYARDPISQRLPFGNSLSGRLTLKYAPAGSPFDVTFKGSLSQVNDSGAGPYERLCAAGRTTPRPITGLVDPYVDCKIDGVTSTADLNPTVAAGVPFARNGDPYTDHSSHYAVLTANYHAGKILFSSLTSHYGFSQYDLVNFSGAAAQLFVTFYAKNTQFAQELRASSDFEGPLNFTLGAIYTKTDFTYDSAVLATAPVLDPATGRYDTFRRDAGFVAKAFSSFAELNWHITPTLELAGGARFTHETRDSAVENVYVQPTFRAAFPLIRFTDNFKDNNVSPQATLTWRPTSDHMVYVAYKQGFKSGGYNTSPNLLPTSQQRDGKFGSETVRGFEGGVRLQWPQAGLMMNLTGYNYWYDDLQTIIFDAQTLAQRVFNAGKLHVRGVEVDLLARDVLTPGLKLRASGAYNRATYSDYVGTCYAGQTIAEGCNLDRNPITGAFNSQSFSGRDAPKAPKWSGRVGGEYEFSATKGLDVGLSADLSYTGSYNYTDTLRPDTIQKGFAMLDGSIRFSDPEKRWTLSLIGRNLTNRWVVSNANDTPGQGAGGSGTANGVRADLNAIVGRGRQVYLELGTKF